MVGLEKTFPRHAHGAGVLGRALARAAGAVTAADEDDDDDEDEEGEDEAHGGLRVLGGVDLELRAGRALGIVGPPSSGKTVLLSIIAGLSAPTAGRVELYGKPVPLFDSLPKLMQDGQAWRNVVLLARIMGMSRRWARRRLEEIFAFAGLTGAESQWRRGMATADLQRLAISTMLQIDGAAYLVDSTLGGRDRAFRDRCLERLAERKRDGAALAFTSRELEDAQRLSDELLWLEDGVVAAAGTAASVGEVVRTRRAQERETRLGLSPETERLLDFLRTAIGDIRATDALHAAERSARSGTAERVEWQELAVAAGYDISEAQRVVDRLMRRGGGHVPLVPVFDTRAAIAGAGVETDAGGVRLRLQLEAASAPLELACSIVLVGDDDRRLRLDQPASVTVDEPRLLTLEVVVPDGVLDDGRYRGTIFASVDGPGGRSLLFRRDLLRFDVGTGPGDDEEDALFEAFDPTEFASAVGVERMGDLEWNVVAG